MENGIFNFKNSGECPKLSPLQLEPLPIDPNKVDKLLTPSNGQKWGIYTIFCTPNREKRIL